MEFEIVETLREGEPAPPSDRRRHRRGTAREAFIHWTMRDRAILIPEQEDG